MDIALHYHPVSLQMVWSFSNRLALESPLPPDIFDIFEVFNFSVPLFLIYKLSDNKVVAGIKGINIYEGLR